MSIRVRHSVPWQGQDSFVIETETATYYLHARGGGLASLIDRDGNDWISYRPGGGSAGEYRGIPNCGQAFHPGYPEAAPGKSGCVTTLQFCKPAHARLKSVSDDGAWVATWDFRPDRARFTLEKAAGPYWFLYEGTPGGKLELDRDFYLLPDGVRRPITEDWQAHLPAPRWVFFGKQGLGRGLYLIHHPEPPADVPDQFWPMEGNMTVWGFGRRRRPMELLLTETPARLTFGLLEMEDLADIVPRITSYT